MHVCMCLFNMGQLQPCKLGKENKINLNRAIVRAVNAVGDL